MMLQHADHWAREFRVRMPRRCAAVTERELDGEAVLFDAVTGCTHRLNATALNVWRACDGTQATDDVARDLAERFDVAPPVVLQDIEQLLAAFARAGLVEP
jgi:PqqD family protein of HPr-rel-A system